MMYVYTLYHDNSIVSIFYTPPQHTRARGRYCVFDAIRVSFSAGNLRKMGAQFEYQNNVSPVHVTSHYADPRPPAAGSLVRIHIGMPCSVIRHIGILYNTRG